MTEQNPEQINTNPAWQEVLDALPNDLHPLITPKLEEWDKRVQDKLQEVRSQYDPYEPIIKNNIPLDDIQGALYLAQAFQENPEDVVKRAIEEFGLGYVPKDQIPSSTPDPDEDEYELSDLAGLENHPAFKALMEKVEQANSVLTTQQQREKEEQEAAELEQYLETLHNDHGDFDDLYVNALMANGVTAEDAIKKYKETIASEVQKAVGTNNNNHQQQNPPVVLGGDGHTGSGIPEEPVKMGTLSKGSLNDVVLQFLEQNKTT